MWSQELRDAILLFKRETESKLRETFEVVTGFISEYLTYILIGLTSLGCLVILDLLMDRQEKREKKRLEDELEDKIKDELEDQMKDN